MEQSKCITTAVDLNNISKETITYLEDLSNEVFYEIFDILDFSHVFESFSNLNIRFENLLLNSNLPINMKLSSISKSTFQCYYTQIIIPYQHQIKSLHLTNPFINELCFSSNSIQLKFIRLETLILDKITSEYLGELLNHLISFPYLSSLVVICVDVVTNQNTFYRQIFRLPKLKYCHLSWRKSGGSGLLSFANNELSPIEYLIIKDESHLNELKALLSYVPQLRRLSALCVAKSTDRKMKPCSTMSNCLTYISLKFERINNISFEIFESIIKNLFQQLEVLHISIKHDSTYLDSSRWKRLILSYMPHLQVFDFLFSKSSCSDSDIKEFVAQIDEFNSPFWFEREWFFEYHIDNKEYRQHIIFFSTNPYRRKKYVLYDTTHDYIDENLNIDSVYHLHIPDEQAMIKCVKYFPHVSELTISYESVIESENFLSITLNRIFPLKQLTKLIITYYNGSFSRIIELIRDTPNIHTFEIGYVSFDRIDLVLFEENDSFRLVSQTNNIENLIINYQYTLEQIKLLLNLCSRLKQLTIEKFEGDFKVLLQFLFSKDNTRHLFSLCLKRVPHNEIEILKTFMKSEKLLNDYLLKVESSWSNNIYLWW